MIQSDLDKLDTTMIAWLLGIMTTITVVALCIAAYFYFTREQMVTINLGECHADIRYYIDREEKNATPKNQK